MENKYKEIASSNQGLNVLGQFLGQVDQQGVFDPAKEFLKTGEIPGVGTAKEVQEKEKKEEEEKSYNIDGSLRDKTDPTTYPSGLGTGP